MLNLDLLYAPPCTPPACNLCTAGEILSSAGICAPATECTVTSSPVLLVLHPLACPPYHYPCCTPAIIPGILLSHSCHTPCHTTITPLQVDKHLDNLQAEFDEQRSMASGSAGGVAAGGRGACSVADHIMWALRCLQRLAKTQEV